MHNSLPTPHQPYQKVTYDECLICLEPLNGEIGEVSCGHIYHLTCLSNWIARKGAHRACCICDKNTEIVNVLIFPPPQVNISNNIEPSLPIDNNDLNIVEARENDNILPENRIKKNRCCQIL
tara:strand:- start:162 stop:527 length:366 start_codon:yes stop_codon:yes gene_type:complete